MEGCEGISLPHGCLKTLAALIKIFSCIMVSDTKMQENRPITGVGKVETGPEAESYNRSHESGVIF